MEEPDKIQLDDISFDDMISGEGVTIDAPIEEIEEVENKVEEEVQEEPEQKVVEEQEEEVEEQEEKVQEQEPEETEDDTVISEVLSKLGYELEGDYEDTSDGLVALTKDAATKMAEDNLEELFDKFPIIKKHLEYTLAGGDSKQFMDTYGAKNDYSTLNISKEDVRTQKAILAEYFHAKGHDKDFIEETLEDYEDSGKLFERSGRAKDALVKAQAQQREQLIAKQQEQRQQSEAEQQKFWDGLSKTIDDSTELAGVTLPARDKKKFFDYISKPVTKEGYTQRDLDHKDAKLDVKLAMDYLMYRGFDLDKIIDSKAKTKSAKTLKDKISRSGKPLKSANKASRRKTNVDFDDLSLDLLT
tara:strand:+ start:9632 stop:10705 length:1074 start_codon:yes stop_codon:yes gene_type:complete